MRYIFNPIAALVLVMLLTTSCQKVIDVSLKDSEPAYIIEGEVTDAPGPYFVSVTRSKNFDENNNFPAVEGAVVVIKNTTSNTVDTLTEVSAGRYKTNTTQGVGGNTYELHVIADGKTFVSKTTMPTQAVAIDSMYLRVSDFGGDIRFIVPEYTDPVGFGNRYLLRQYVNGKLLPGTIARSDDVTDGEKSQFPLYYFSEENDGEPFINAGDTLKVELLCVDNAVYEFYRTLDETIDQNSGTPANPLSTFTGGAIGVFKAARINTKVIIADF